MRRLYHEDIGPDGQVLGRRQRPGNYPAASGSLHKRIEAEVAQRVAEAGGIITPEEVREIRLRLRAQWRNRVPFYDYTFSVPKSLSVLWASLLQAEAEAKAEHREADAELYAGRAEQVRAAVKRANDRMIRLAEQRLAYVRTGHHSATSGEWRDARGSSWPASRSTPTGRATRSFTCTTPSPTGRSARTKQTRSGGRCTGSRCSRRSSASARTVSGSLSRR